MRAFWTTIPALMMLTACGDPLAGVERVSDGVKLPDADASAALPTQQELDREDSILSGLFRKPSEPEANVPQVDTPDEEIPEVLVSDALEDGVLGDVAIDVADTTEDVADRTEDVVADATETEGVVSPSDATVAVENDIVVPEETPVVLASAKAPEAKSKGVLGWLRRAAEAQDAADVAPQNVALGVDNKDVTVDSNDAIGVGEDKDIVFDATPDGGENAPSVEVQLASLSPDDIPGAASNSLTEPSGAATENDFAEPDALVEPKKRRGLFGQAAAAPTAGLLLRDVTMGTTLPFGEIGRVCGVTHAALGKRIDQAARKGSDYALYDSAPDSTAPRTFYVTGFSDNCARQFTASLALFGAPEFHEQLRYGLPAKEYPYSTTDTAYEKVKKSVCKVGRDAPCGQRIERLSQTTVFVSVYEHFEENARWADMLLHDGALLATAVKTP
ncbi:MAG: hypothetical protein ABJF86_18610 [Tateyamaria sp.]|uniref:hypothetical protein n=1 Tax=Tateyamaria sp. TaxID=1929288 RepID=UPI003286F9F5